MTLHNTRFFVENKESLNNRESVDEKISLENPVLHLHVLLLHLQAHKLIFSEIWVLLKKKKKGSREFTNSLSQETTNNKIHFYCIKTLQLQLYIKELLHIVERR